MSREQISRGSATALGALAGLVAAIVALGAAEFVAGLKRSWKGPILDVGDRVIDRVPPGVKDFAIEQFGTNDKPALLVGIGAILAVSAAVIGALAFRWRIWVGVVGIGAFGVVGAYAALTRRVGGSWTDALPSVIGATLGAAALWLVHHVADPGRSRELLAHEGAQEVHENENENGVGRREVLVRAGGLLALLALAGTGAGAVGRALKHRFGAAESRANLTLPSAVEPLAPIADTVSVGLDGITPFITPNADFYRIDTALSVPQLPTEDYELRVTGMVEHELRLSFDDLLRRDLVEYDITLTCVSNTVGGNLIGNARWLGVRLDELLADAGAARCRPGRRPLDRRLHVRLPVGGGDRRAQRHRRHRHERRAAAPRARLPRPTRRARPLRLRLGDEVAGGDRADDVRGVPSSTGCRAATPNARPSS